MIKHEQIEELYFGEALVRIAQMKSADNKYGIERSLGITVDECKTRYQNELRDIREKISSHSEHSLEKQLRFVSQELEKERNCLDCAFCKDDAQDKSLGVVCMRKRSEFPKNASRCPKYQNNEEPSFQRYLGRAYQEILQSLMK